MQKGKIEQKPSVAVWQVADPQELEKLKLENAALLKRTEQMQGVIDALRGLKQGCCQGRVRHSLLELDRAEGKLVKDVDGFWSRPGVELAKVKKCETCGGTGKMVGRGARSYRFTERCWTCCGTGSVKAY